ncbi:MAG: hypothetical protein ACI4TI_03145 [Christensenellales bacterium]
MEYNGILFDAIVATPGCGKSYLCDRHPDIFVDVDEVRLRCKYVVPENITRDELEKTKGNRPFPRKAKHDEYIKDMNKQLDQYVSQGKTLICAPHPEAIEYLVKNNIKFAFVYQNSEMKEEQVKRMKQRGNSQELIDENCRMFDTFLEMNKKENKSVIHYEFGPNEYLEDIVKKFGCKF